MRYDTSKGTLQGADDPDHGALVIDDERAQMRALARAALGTAGAHSSIATKRPCHQWYQTAPVCSLTESMPVILPSLSVWSVK